MLTNKVLSTLLIVVSMTSTSMAQLKPGQGSGGSGGNQNQPNPPRYQDGCQNNYGPCEPGRPSRPDRPHNPERPDRPERPGNGHDRPDYGRPDYPDYGRPDRPNPPHRPPNRPPQRPDYPNYPPPRPDYPNYPPPRPDYPNYPDYGQQEVRSGYIGRSVRNERFNLRQLVGLDSYYAGWEVVAVRAVARPNSSSTTVARLVNDGRIIASQTNPGYEIGLYPQTRLILGSNTQGLQLEIVGSTYVEQVEVIVQRTNGGGGYPPPVGGDGQIDIPLYRNTYGNDQIDLNPYIDFYRYNGYRIEQIIVQARSSYGTGIVDFLINGFNMGSMQFRDGGYSSQDSLYISQRPMIGRDAGSLMLHTRGNLTIENVSIILSRY